MNIFIALAIILSLFIPYIICSILAIVVIGVINTKSIKNKKSKILIIVIILLCVLIVSINFKDEKPNDSYIEMNNISDSQELIGLSKEQVIALLGEPAYEYNKEKNTIFRYSAGGIEKGLFLFNKAIHISNYETYKFEVVFNEDNKVESTHIQHTP